LNKDPDNVNYQRGWKNLQKLEKLKKDGTDAFAAASFKEAIERFSECLELDPLNNSYNSTILFNRSMAYIKVSQYTEAMKDLDRAIEINEDYTKAYLKRGDVHMLQLNYEEAVRDFEKAR
jgi:DnaJ family protein C protein 7